MQAILFPTYGSPAVLQLADVPMPQPRDHEVLVKVVAASAAAGDWHRMRGAPKLLRLVEGLFKPRNPRLGADVAGIVEAVGKHVTEFRPGDELFGDLSAYGYGAFAEYVAAPAQAFAHKPQNLTLAEAATVSVSAITALQGLRDHGHIQPGQRVLINGASGGVGTFAVQLAKAFGAEVTAVCSTSKVAMVRALGATHVIDYTRQDFTKWEVRYDLILAANGYQPLATYQQMLTPQGRFVMTGGTMAQMFEAMLLGPLRSKKGGQQLMNVLAKPNQADLYLLKELIEAGKVRPVIDRTFPLPDTAEAIGYLETGHAKGKVVITVAA